MSNNKMHPTKLARQRLKEDLVQSEAALDAMENEALLQNEKIGILTKSLERLKSNSSQDLLNKEKVEALEKEMNIKAELKATHASELDQVKTQRLEMANRVQSDQLTQLATFRNELERTEEALSVSRDKLLKAEEQLAQMRVQQKEQDSIEDQIINASVSKKDDLLREFEKTSLLKELEQTNAALSKSKHQQAKAENELDSMLSQQKQMDFIKEQLSSSLTEKGALLKELERTKEALCLLEGKDAHTRMQHQEMKRDEAAALDSNRDEASSQPQDVNEHDASMLRRHMSNSLSIDTSRSVADASLDRGPSSAPARSSSSAVVPRYKKFHSLKQRYLEKVRASSPTKGVDSH